MKNRILSAVILLTIGFNGAASPPDPAVNEKAQATFTSVFRNAVNISWRETANSSVAFFIANGVKTRATFNNKGNLIQTVRYYTEYTLSPVVLASVISSFPGQEIHGVIETCNKHGVNYRIILKNNKQYTHINANSIGDVKVVLKYTRGDK